MKKPLIAAIALGLMASACGPKTPELTSGINMENLDTTANPLDDFYQYACGGWMKNNPLDAEYSRYGSFDKLAENNREQLKGLIDSIAIAKNEKGSVAEKIATFYNIGMDSVRLQEQGNQPIQPLLDQIIALSSRDDLRREIVSLHLNGIDPFFGLFNEPDYTNSKMQLAWIYQAGLGMEDRDYYLLPENAKLRTEYLTLMTTEFQLSGYAEKVNFPAEKLAKMVLDLETQLAKAQFDKEVNRDPQKTFHKMTPAEADKQVSGVHFAEYFKAMGLPNLSAFNLAQPSYLAEVGRVLDHANVESIKAYLAWNVINSAASFLSEDFVNADFAFYGVAMSGKEQNQPRWKRVTATLNGALSEAIGQLYVAKYFPPEAKQRMTQLVDNLKEAFAQRIDQAAWMDPATKEKGKEKLAAILVKVGYPDEWRDYSKLEIKGDSYFANVLRSNAFDVQYMLSKIDKPTNRNEWLMPPQQVNAYYNPTTNEICFPAAILQPPFFNLAADDAVNYGAIGVVIGHEMTHGFDDHGHQYDKEGNLNNWWQPSDSINFANNAEVLVNHFNGIKVLDDPETYANGRFTLGENIADNGGIHMSFLAMQNAIERGQVNPDAMDGFTAAQRFFIAYAGVWASNIRDKEIQRLTAIDEHSLARWRVNGTLPHIAEFIDTWKVQPTNKMYLAPESRVQLW